MGVITPGTEKGKENGLAGPSSEEDAKLAQKLSQLQPFIDAFCCQKCMRQLASFGLT